MFANLNKFKTVLKTYVFKLAYLTVELACMVNLCSRILRTNGFVFINLLLHCLFTFKLFIILKTCPNCLVLESF